MRVKMWLMVAMAVALAVPVFAAPAAQARACSAVKAAGTSYPVRIKRGAITCRRARHIIKVAIEQVSWPKGWHCFFGHGDDRWALQCLRGPIAHPRTWIRAANPTA